MATLTITITKGAESQPWIRFNSPTDVSSMFTQDEINSILIPNRDYIRNLPGWQNSTVSDINVLTMMIIHTFDTIENANSALQLLESPAPGTPPYTMRQFINEKKTQLGVTYNYNSSTSA
jgi:hypothetical protein